MAKAKEIFTRYELKYLITIDTYRTLFAALNSYTNPDPFGDGEGRYRVISLYFDSEDNKIYYETVNKLPFRQKLRLRVYDDDRFRDQAFLEIKQKYNNVVNKRRTSIFLDDAYRIMESLDCQDSDGFNVSNAHVFKEILSYKRSYQLKPKVVVSYDRHALHVPDNPDVRITFDYNLMCRNRSLRVEEGAYGERFVDEDLVILEVKVSNNVPLWLSRLLSEHGCNRGSVSKYCTSVDTVECIDSVRTDSLVPTVERRGNRIWSSY